MSSQPDVHSVLQFCSFSEVNLPSGIVVAVRLELAIYTMLNQCSNVRIDDIRTRVKIWH